MDPVINDLMALQRLDVEAKRLREELAALPKQVAELERQAKAVEGQRAVVVDLAAKEDVGRRRLESDVADLEAKAARLRKQMDAATTAVQVTAYEHEIGFARKEIARLEDAQLESMERSEELAGQRGRADAAVKAAAEKLVTGREKVAGAKQAAEAALAEVEAARAAQRGALAGVQDGEPLGVYDRLARAKGTAVAEVWLQKCLACQMLLRPQRWNDLRERDSTERMTCDSCGRLLWLDPARDAPQRPAVVGESIAAQIVRGR